MAYVHPNFKTKKALKEAVARGAEVTVFQPGYGKVSSNGRIGIEGPHGYHTWYGMAQLKDGVVTKVD